MMKTAAVLALSITWFAVPASAGEDSLASLGWISGTWAGTSGGTRQMEHWSDPDGGLLLGVHRDVLGDGRAFFEFLRIERRGEDIVYVAMPRGERATAFTLVEQGDRRAVFENPEHDFPTRIVYERFGDTLSATISGPANGETRSTGWSWRRVVPE